MIYQSEHIYFPDLSPLFFGEEQELDFYPYQKGYLPKLVSDTKFIAFFSEDVYNADDVKMNIYSETDELLYSVPVGISEKNATYYYSVIPLRIETVVNNQDVIGYITLESDTLDVLARSTYYLFNPSYTGDIKKITYTNEDNDFNVIFVDGSVVHEYTIDIECGFIPKDVRTEQLVEEFVGQDLINNVVYGDEYIVYPLTIGDSLGIPSWLAALVSKCTLCDKLTINDKEYERIEGTKLEKIEDTYNGLAIYKIDLQNIFTNLQTNSINTGIFDSTFDNTFN